MAPNFACARDLDAAAKEKSDVCSNTHDHVCCENLASCREDLLQ